MQSLYGRKTVDAFMNTSSCNKHEESIARNVLIPAFICCKCQFPEYVYFETRGDISISIPDTIWAVYIVYAHNIDYKSCFSILLLLLSHS